MSRDVEVSSDANNTSDPSGGGRNGGNGMGALLATVLSGVGSLYLATESISVTIIGAVVALIAAVLYLAYGRK
ncbi:hypothetical protein [Kribbella sp. NPDC051718]|uniref:hypothetical protein n=1 Tax=Kribbella sp. NPDC051718 TaxID=3155168 RepID=UPI00341A41B3